MASLHLAQEILNIIWPVGSIYLSWDGTNPKSKFGGTWTKLSGGYLYGSTVDSNGSTGNQGSGTWTQTFVLQNKHLPGRAVVRTEGKAGSAMVNAVDINSGWSNHALDDSGFGEEKNVGHNHAIPYIAVNIWRRTA